VSHQYHTILYRYLNQSTEEVYVLRLNSSSHAHDNWYTILYPLSVPFDLRGAIRGPRNSSSREF
jgi:hypothetical protein